MLKKVVITFIMCFLLVVTSAFSQETKLQQYQTFSWAAIKNARKYEVNIERLNDDETWTFETSESTTANRLEMLLYPGKYRVSISAFNILNRKASQSDWVTFIILDETEPFIFANTFNGDKETIGSLYSKPESTDTKALGEEVSYSQNSFRIMGKNIYFTETEFYLVPISPDSSMINAVTSYTDNRPEVKLEILSRDSTNNEVIVSYDETQLFTGLYKLVVKNPGDLTTSIEVNVYTSGLCKINEKQYKYNRRYKVPTLELERNDETKFTIEGTNFSSDASFSLVPSEGIPYPYSSIAERESIPLTLENKSEVNKKDKSTSLSFSFDTSTIETGYYLFTADYGQRGKATELLLIDVIPGKEVELPQITGIKTKYNKKLNQLEFTVSGKELDKDAQAVLISPFSETDGNNTKHNLKLTEASDNKKKIKMTAETQNLEEGTYTFLLETQGTQAVTYVSIDKNFKTKLKKITPEQVEELFLRPLDEEVTEVTQTDSSIVDLEPSKKTVSYFTEGQIFFGPSNKETIDLGFNLTLVEFGNISYEIIYAHCFLGINDLLESSFRYNLIDGYFKPYIGGGFGFAIPRFDYVYLPFYVGIKLFNIIDIRYNFITVCDIEVMDYSVYFIDSIYAGISLCFKPQKKSNNKEKGNDKK